MSIRDLTQEEISRLLTQEEVDALPDGTVVHIKWSGGNGPHTYTIKHGPLYTHALYEGRDVGRLSFVGKARFNTRVFLAEES